MNVVLLVLQEHYIVYIDDSYMFIYIYRLGRWLMMNAVQLVLQEHYIVLLMIVICVQQGQEIKDHA